MTVLGALARVRDAGESRAIQATAWGSWDVMGGQTWAGANVSTSSSLQLLTVYGCTRFICDGISTLPIHAFEGVGGVRRQVESPRWLREPTPDLDFVSWSTQVLSSWLLAGDTFVVPDFGRDGLSQAVPLDPTAVEVHRVAGRKMFRVNGVDHSSVQVVHVPGVMFPGADRGLSPVEAARQTIGQGMSAQEYGARFFGQGATLSGVIEVPGELTPDKAGEMARSWQKKHGGKSKANLPGVLQGGAVWKPTGVTNEQAQFLETRRFTAAEIAASMFLIDPPEMGIGVEGQSLTYSNLEQRNTRKVQTTFLPWIVRLENLVTRLLPQGQYAKLNVAGLLRGDTKTRFESYGIGLDKDFITVDEVRAWEELHPLPEQAAAPPALTEQIEAVGQLIRAGFEPEAALEFLGLPPIKHTGLVPITVTQESP